MQYLKHIERFFALSLTICSVVIKKYNEYIKKTIFKYSFLLISYKKYKN